MCCLQGIHLPDRHTERDREQKTEGKQQRKAVNFLLSSSTLLTTAFFSFLIWFLSEELLTRECIRFCNSHRKISRSGWRSLLLANNSTSCSQAVSLYEKIWENDAVRVYCDLVWTRNPIKMMKKPHLCTSLGWAGW